MTQSDQLSAALREHAARQDLMADIALVFASLIIIALLVRWWRTPNT